MQQSYFGSSGPCWVSTRGRESSSRDGVHCDREGFSDPRSFVDLHLLPRLLRGRIPSPGARAF